VKIKCGDWDGHKGPIKYNTPAYYMDVELPKSGLFEITIKKAWNSIIYPYEGEVEYSA
jgi:redox-sensitive bicupin YhaK (pirin superfamily)